MSQESESKPLSGKEIDSYLQSVSTGLVREQTADRVLRAFVLDPLHVLALPHTLPLVDKQTVNNAFKKTSLLVHPDKCTHPHAQKAFDKLKKAQLDLTDDRRRGCLALVLEEAEFKLRKQHGMGKSQSWKEGGSGVWERMLRLKSKDIMVEDELRKRRAQKREVELEAELRKSLEEEEKDQRQQREAQKAWEATRDGRVNSWRTFQKDSKKKGLKVPKTVQVDAEKPYIKRPRIS